MGEVITQLGSELRDAQFKARYNLVKGGFSGILAGLRGFFGMLWRRPLGFVSFVLAIVLWALIGSLGVALLVLALLWGLAFLVLWVLIQAQLKDSDNPEDSSIAVLIINSRREIRNRRLNIMFKKEWPDTVNDLGLTTTIQRKGVSHVVTPKLIKVEDRK